MKQLTCEMCGSTDLIKQDGVFVCQSCGAKYSIEEAKKMMVEGTVDIQGTVKVDNERKIANLRQLANRARETGDSKTAAQYYGQLLLEAPDDWAANFYTVYYDAHNIRIAQIGSAATRVGNVLDSVFQLIVKERDEKISQLGDSQDSDAAIQRITFETEAKSAGKTIANDVYSFFTMLVNNMTSHLGDTIESRDRAMREWLQPTMAMMIQLGDCLIKYFDDFDSAKSAYELGCNSGLAEIQKIAQSRLSDVERLKKEKAEKDRTKYWAEHQAEKDALEAEKASLQEKISALEADKKTVPGQAEAETLRVRIQQLTTQCNSLGLFKGKEKRALKELIDTASNELSTIQAKVDKATLEIQAKIYPLKNRIAEIGEELTRDR